MTNQSHSASSQTPAPAKKYVGAGVILVRLSPDGAPRVLLLLGRETGVWSFSKGHPEESDRGSPLRTAVRETAEETGYEVGRDYQIIGDSLRFGKRPYWIGVMADNARPVMLAEREHTAAGWFTVEEAAALPSNTDVRAWVKKAAGGCPTAGWTRLIRAISSAAAAAAASSIRPRRLSVLAGIAS